jgi:transcriptional regulator NrdR family protein
VSRSLRCPECGVMAPSVVTDTRMSRDGLRIRRRRKCSNGHRFTTYEQEPAEPAEWSDRVI